MTHSQQWARENLLYFPVGAAGRGRCAPQRIDWLNGGVPVALRSSYLVGLTAAVAAVAVAGVVYVHSTRDARTWATLQTVCADCHNDIDYAGDLSFAGLTPDSIPAHRETFEAVVRKLRGHLMPPPGSTRPAQPVIDALVSRIETTLDDGPPPAVGQ